jgi:hypothetical protein
VTENGEARSSSGLADKADERNPSGKGGEAQRINEMEEAPQRGKIPKPSEWGRPK